jgi:uncharacterized protein
MLKFPIYSADSHVIEPSDLWLERIEPKFRDRAPRVIHLDDTDLWVVDNNIRMAVVGIQNQAGLRFDNPKAITKKGRYDEIPIFTPEHYIQDLDRDGVKGAILYSSNAHQAYHNVEHDLLSAILQSYNDWVLEFCSAYPNRLKAVSLINVDDPIEGAREMERTAKIGAAGFMIPILPRPRHRYDQPQYEIIWKTAEDLGLPISLHVNSLRAVLGEFANLDLPKHATQDHYVQASVATLVLSGVFARHPKLKMVVVEFGTSWMSHLIKKIDKVYKQHWQSAVVRFPDGEMPSDYLHRNIYTTFQEDIPGIHLRDLIGVNNMMWANDYPHAESTFPRSLEFLVKHFEGIPEAEAAKIAGGNVRELYGFTAVT